MLLKEKLTDSSLFNIISSKVNWVEPVPGETLYFMYINKFGDRTLISSLENVNVNLIGESLAAIFGPKWNILVNKLTTDILPDNGNEQITYQENTVENVTETTSDNETSTSKVSAYNVDDFANDESNSNVKDGNRINDNTKKKDYTKTRSVSNSISITASYIEMLLKYNICDIIFSDINNFISTKIIDLEV